MRLAVVIAENVQAPEVLEAPWHDLPFIVTFSLPLFVCIIYSVPYEFSPPIRFCLEDHISGK
jgi:hypothetical protein